jgi:hypothetical protein
VNLTETGALDGGSAEQFDQFPGPPGAETVVVALRHALGLIDMSGAPWTRSLWFLVGAGVLVATAGALVRRSHRTALALLVAAGLAASVVALPLAYEAADRAVFKAGLILGAERGFLATLQWEIQTQSHGAVGYGPLAAVLLAAGTALAVSEFARGRLATRALVFVSAPWILLVTLALTVIWDPWRLRFLAFGVALAASVWGIALRSRPISFAGAAIGATALALSLGNIDFKPSGIGPSHGIWSTPRWVVYGRIAGGSGGMYRYVEHRIPRDAHVALALPYNQNIHAFFGEHLSREISLVHPDTLRPSPRAEWLVVAPTVAVRRCGAWRLVYAESDWSIERRVRRDACVDG